MFSDRFNNSDKGAVSHAIVHRVLWEYLVAINDIDDESEREKLRRDMFETYVSPLLCYHYLVLTVPA
jgi:hypothetical protein